MQRILTGNWQHEGAYSYELSAETANLRKKITVPKGTKGVRRRGNTIYVKSGVVKQTYGGLLFYSSGTQFHGLPFGFTDKIFSGDGKLIYSDEERVRIVKGRSDTTCS